MTRKMKADLRKAGNMIALGQCNNLLSALLTTRVNVFYVMDLPEFKMTSLGGSKTLVPYELWTKLDVRNYWLTRIAMMVTMPEDMIDPNL